MTIIVESQRTLACEISFSGVGLHNGRHASVCIRPGVAGAGIVFSRTDQSRYGLILGEWRNVVSTEHSTTLGNSDGATIATVEHLLAAFYGCGVDNAWVEVDGPEIPILDGSAKPIVELISRVGTVSQALPRRYMRIRTRTAIEHRDSVAVVQPSESPEFTARIEFPSTVIGRQAHKFRPGESSFSEDIAGARTFAMLGDIARLHENGLGLGGSLENSIIVGSNGVLNRSGLRYSNEFVRHKLLDVLGDLSLCGARVLGSVEIYRPGHTINHRLVQKLYAHSGLWEYTMKPLRYPLEDINKRTPFTGCNGHGAKFIDRQ